VIKPKRSNPGGDSQRAGFKRLQPNGALARRPQVRCGGREGAVDVLHKMVLPI
jgi:hypothetical protein